MSLLIEIACDEIKPKHWPDSHPWLAQDCSGGIYFHDSYPRLDIDANMSWFSPNYLMAISGHSLASNWMFPIHRDNYLKLLEHW